MGPRDVRAHAARPLVPMPHWLSELLGVEATKAAVWFTTRSVVVRARTARGPVLVELTLDANATLRGFRIDTSRTPPARAPLAALGAMTPEQRNEIARFVARLRWAYGVEERAHGGLYVPVPVERELRTIARALFSVTSGQEVGRITTSSGIGAANATMSAIELYLDVLRGDWHRVFTELDRAAAGAWPSWIAPLLIGLGGDVEAMRALAHDATRRDDGDESGLAILAVTAFDEAGLLEAALAVFRRAVEAVPGPDRAFLYLALAKSCRVRGRMEDCVEWARRALLLRDDDVHLVARACFELIRCGQFDDAELVLRRHCAREPCDPDLALALAELLAWAARPDEAREWLERASFAQPEEPRRLRCAGVVHALERRWTEARDCFLRARELAPDDMESATWLVEISLRLGDEGAAERFLADARAVAQTPIHIVLRAALDGAERVQRELHALLAFLGEPEASSPAEPGRERLLSLLERRFGGNRGELPTVIRREGEPGLGLRVLRLPHSDAALSARDLAAQTLKLIGTVSFDELRARFESLAVRFGTSPHPFCYWGELELWLGHYDRAIELFQAALAREQARWGYVGQAAAHILRGEHDAAHELLTECARHFAPVFGATTHVYVGESRRRRGDARGAIEELEVAVAAKPTRAAAWMNLALAHESLGHFEEAHRIFDRLEAWLPRLHWDAWKALGQEPRWPIPKEHMSVLYEKALEMMRGNRSSHTITYFDGGGVFRIARDARAWRAVATQRAFFVGLGLTNRLAAGLPHEP